MSAIKISGLSKSFGVKQVLKDVSLDVTEGEILAIMGSSGGGKTTLLKCISGLLKPTNGTVELFGKPLTQSSESHRLIGLVFQSAALFDYLSVKDNVLFGVKRHLKLTQNEQDLLCAELLETVDLAGTEKLMPAELSGGMKKRAGIARALALNPKILLYDEPVTGLDPVTAYTIDQLIHRVNSKYQTTSVVVSHDVTSVFRIADRVAFLDSGELAFMGNRTDFEGSQQHAIRELLQKSYATTFDQI